MLCAAISCRGASEHKLIIFIATLTQQRWRDISRCRLRDKCWPGMTWSLYWSELCVAWFLLSFMTAYGNIVFFQVHAIFRHMRYTLNALSTNSKRNKYTNIYKYIQTCRMYIQNTYTNTNPKRNPYTNKYIIKINCFPRSHATIATWELSTALSARRLAVVVRWASLQLRLLQNNADLILWKVYRLQLKRGLFSYSFKHFLMFSRKLIWFLIDFN